jgi:hypothetical protein
MISGLLGSTKDLVLGLLGSLEELGLWRGAERLVHKVLDGQVRIVGKSVSFVHLFD